MAINPREGVKIIENANQTATERPRMWASRPIAKEQDSQIATASMMGREASLLPFQYEKRAQFHLTLCDI